MWSEMLECHFWANRALLQHLEQLTEEQFNQPIPSSFPTIQATVVHILNSERWLLGNYRGEPLPKLEREQLERLDGIRTAWAETEALWRQALADLNEASLQRDLTVRFTNGQTTTLKAWQVLHQLIEHGPYHRGQVITMLHQVGAPTLKTDPLVYHITKAKA